MSAPTTPSTPGILDLDVEQQKQAFASAVALGGVQARQQMVQAYQQQHTQFWSQQPTRQ